MGDGVVFSWLAHGSAGELGVQPGGISFNPGGVEIKINLPI